MTGNQIFQIIKRDAVDIFSDEGLMKKLTGGKQLKIKLGADPSRPDLHLGHSVVLKKLRLFQDAGHQVIFVIGDFTGMIGDPSGRSKTRVPLTFDQTRQNGQTYFEQVTKILDPDKTKIIYNSEWLDKMNFSDVLSLAGKYTLAQILERDDFSKRYTNNQPVGMHELFYPLMQGYDSVALCADVEVGGTDQTFNLLVGRELQKDYGQEPQEVITFPLLPGLDGVEKMSKSLDNYIGIDEAPEIMFEKCMKIPDVILSDYFRLTTDISEDIYDKYISENIRNAHFIYAREIVRLYHGQEAIEMAEERYKAIAAGGTPDNMECLTVEENKISVVELLIRAGFAGSNSDAKRLILGKGIKIDGQLVADVSMTLETNAILSKGKNKFIEICFSGKK